MPSNSIALGRLQMGTKRFVLTLVLLILAALSAVTVYGADMVTGTWKLNVAKSTYAPGTAPKEGVGKIQAVDNGLKVELDGVDASGKKTHTEYTVKFDGKEYPVKTTLDGKPNPNGPDTISARKTDDYTFEFTTKSKGKVIGNNKDVIAKDGKTLAITATGQTPDGKPFTNKLVAEKQ